MNRPIIIIGAGGHAKVVLNVLLSRSYSIEGFTDCNKNLHGSSVMGKPVLGDDSVIITRTKNEILLANGIGGSKSTLKRGGVFSDFKIRGYSFLSAIHPNAIVAPDALFGEGTQIMAGAVIQPGVILGSNVIVNTNASIDHDCVIGDNVHVAPGATLSGSVIVDDNSYLSTGCSIVQGIKIGRNCLIAAGATVIDNVMDHSVVMGVPARPYRK